MKTRDTALALLRQYTQSTSLLQHALSVEACMVWYANYFTHQQVPDIDPVEWAITGLLHDFDYEKYPDPVAPDGHPFKGHSILAELGYSDAIRAAIMGHAHYTHTPRESLMAKVLFAVDELSGLITASVLVRPDRDLNKLEVKSVVKKFKDKAFARGCNREDIRLGAEEIKISLDQHIANCIEAMRPLADQIK